MSANHKLEHQLLTQPTEVKFCTRCVVSNQRPRIVFDAGGVCSACRFADEKNHVIEWKNRETQLEHLLDQHRSKAHSFDVVVPSSGGKDSSYVASRLIGYGMHPLCVTWAPFRRTPIGQQNFDNFIKSGFTVIEGHPNGALHRQLARFCFEELGDAWQPFAYGQMSFAFHIALRFGIKIIFFGENGEAEYGGDPKNNYLPYMPAEDWARLYFKGTGINDLIPSLHLKGYIERLPHPSIADRTFYKPPSPRDLKKAGIQMHWFSYYNRWRPQEHYYYASQNTGFTANPQRSEGTYSRYASLDDMTDGFHFYMAYIKFGIGRATSDAAHEIRDGHITREEGVSLVHRYDGEFPQLYFQEFLDYLGIDKKHFQDVVDSWRPPHLWDYNEGHGKWALKHRVS